MKKLLAKIRNKKLKGNVSLLVIFILLASSVISLLSINQIQRLLTYGNMTFDYFRAFYLAKAWTELGLTEVYNRWDGFNHRVESWSAIITWNLLPEYAWFDPYFDMTITWSFEYLTDDIRESDKCSEGNKIKLIPWAWIMLSLFSDKTKWINKILSGSKNLVNLEGINNLSITNPDSSLTFAFFTYNNSDEMEDIVVKEWWDLSSFLSNNAKPLINSKATKKYLTIKNSWDKDVEFCVTMGGKLIPYSDSLITVFWHYGDMEVGLQSVVKKWVPDWMLNVIGQGP